tara:strand:+ start:2853 stop:4889 length:2037 start_codon:yes stop_codon:yes gene_type:complete
VLAQRKSSKKAAPQRTASRGHNLQLEPDLLEDFYRTAVRIRTFEERVQQAFEENIIKGTAHSSVGQEAIAVATCANLRDDDFIATHHRGHGHCIAKGASIDRMMAELMGREDGYCQGLGGSMHIANLDLKILGANGIVGAAMPLGLGAALTAKMRTTDQVAVSFFGDGGANQGLFHEAMNLAAVWKLPLIFICENNQYALSTAMTSTTSVPRISDRAVAYNVPGTTVDGNDAAELFHVMRDAVDRARAGEGPSLIEALTWRWGQHSVRGGIADPRSDDDKDHWIARDPLLRLEEDLLAQKVTTKRGLTAIRKKAVEECEDAIAFGDASPEPDEETMHNSVYSPHATYDEPTSLGERELTYTQALNEAMHQEMERDESVFIMGEDIGATGGIFGTTKGLHEKFGEVRVRDTPISEPAFCGAGVGAAVAGMRPIVEVQIFDFVTLMMDMLVNQAAKFRYMMGGEPTVPLVVRGPQGGGIRLAAQHSQSLEAWFAHVPGLVVVAPSSPYDAKGLLTAAIRDDNPVVFLEHKLLYFGDAAPVPEEPYAIPLGKADIKREGSDVTIIATQAMVARALSAAQQLENEGISVEVIDPRTLRPLDEETILESVCKTNRLVVVHEAWTRGGFGSEVSAMVMEKAFDWLDAPVTRVGAPDVPMPFNDRLELAVIPSVERIVDAVRDLF